MYAFVHGREHTPWSCVRISFLSLQWSAILSSTLLFLILSFYKYSKTPIFIQFSLACNVFGFFVKANSKHFADSMVMLFSFVIFSVFTFESHNVESAKRKSKCFRRLIEQIKNEIMLVLRTN